MATSLALLPKFVVLKSLKAQKYLSLTKNVPSNLGIPSGFLKCDGETVVNPLAKFEVEMAKIGNGLVNIRSCFNNKYLVPFQPTSAAIGGDDAHWIVAAGKEPVEDQSKKSCTLFELFYTPESQTLKLRHIQFASLVHLSEPGTSPFSAALCTHNRGGNQSVYSEFQVINWEELVIIPKRVAFKSPNTGNYLCSRWMNIGYKNQPHLRFEPDIEIGDPSVANEVFMNADGSLRIRNEATDFFWAYSTDNWIWSNAQHHDVSSNTLFQATKVQDNVFVLRNMRNERFCGSWPGSNCYNASYKTITKETMLVAEELVLSRNIYNIKFREHDARIYDEHVIEFDTAHAINHNPEAKSTVSLKFNEKDVRSHTITNSSSWKLGAKTTIQLKFLPLIVDGKIEISGEYGATSQKGDTTTDEHVREVNYSVDVPPNTKVSVTLTATRASCDVPFSYTQRDLLPDGQVVVKEMDDGLFTGINSYSFDYKNTKTAI